MYHSHTPEPVKEMIRHDMQNPNGNIRVLVCTNAAGMGVNYPGVNFVVNYGPPREMNTLSSNLALLDVQVHRHIICSFTGRDSCVMLSQMFLNMQETWKNITPADVKSYSSNIKQTKCKQ